MIAWKFKTYNFFSWNLIRNGSRRQTKLMGRHVQRQRLRKKHCSNESFDGRMRSTVHAAGDHGERRVQVPWIDSASEKQVWRGICADIEVEENFSGWWWKFANRIPRNVQREKFCERFCATQVPRCSFEVSWKISEHEFKLIYEF